MNKKVATIILNRNLPKVTDALYEKIDSSCSGDTDIYIVESGSEEAKLSKNYTWWADWSESLEQGLRFPRGFNFALQKLFEEKKYDNYDYFLLMCNDAVVPDDNFIRTLVKIMEKHSHLGILSPCSEDWGEKSLVGDGGLKYFWYINQVSWMLRRSYIDDVREVENPTYMNFLYDGENFRGYESEIELIIKGYVNDWATAITTDVMVEENKEHLLTKADLIKTEPLEESLTKCLEEGKKWMRRKYGFNSRWSMQMYAKFFYEKFFEYHPKLEKYRI